MALAAAPTFSGTAGLNRMKWISTSNNLGTVF
jgi:hypothetical protein